MAEHAANMADIAALIEPEAQALGFDLVRVALFTLDGDLTLQIMAERPATGQLTIDDCAALSRRVSEKFDALEEAGKDPIDSAYRLEVSSPGIDRPLTRLKDFAGWIGHDARVALATAVEAEGASSGRKALTGPIAAVDGDQITIDDRKSGRVTFGFGDVADAKLLLTDRLLAAAAPLSTAGADEIEEIDDSTDEED